MHSPKNPKNTQIDRRPSLLSIMELLNWTLNDWRKVIRSDESPFQVCPEKIIIWPRNKDFMEPIEKMKILIWLAITASRQPWRQILSLKKSVNVTNNEGNIFPSHLIPEKHPVKDEESITTRFIVQYGAWTRQRLC